MRVRNTSTEERINNEYNFTRINTPMQNILLLSGFPVYVTLCRNNRVTGWLTSIPKRMEVVLMNNNYFDFKDLMAFGMFILALLTFVLTFCK